MRSAPPPPVSVSSPAAPVSTSAPSPPSRVSVPSAPLTTSAPASPARMSLPMSPRTSSLPPPPAMVSLPAAPWRRFGLPSPVKMSSPGPPTRCSTRSILCGVGADGAGLRNEVRVREDRRREVGVAHGVTEDVRAAVVRAAAAERVQLVVARPAGQGVGPGAAGQRVVAAAAGEALDLLQRLRVDVDAGGLVLDARGDDVRVVRPAHDVAGVAVCAARRSVRAAFHVVAADERLEEVVAVAAEQHVVADAAARACRRRRLP